MYLKEYQVKNIPKKSGTNDINTDFVIEFKSIIIIDVRDIKKLSLLYAETEVATSNRSGVHLFFFNKAKPIIRHEVIEK